MGEFQWFSMVFHCRITDFHHSKSTLMTLGISIASHFTTTFSFTCHGTKELQTAKSCSHDLYPEKTSFWTVQEMTILSVEAISIPIVAGETSLFPPEIWMSSDSGLLSSETALGIHLQRRFMRVSAMPLHCTEVYGNSTWGQNGRWGGSWSRWGVVGNWGPKKSSKSRVRR